MAFIGIAALSLALIIILVTTTLLGIAMIVIGTVMSKKNIRKKLATAIRICGYFVLVPTIATAIIVITAKLIG